MDRGRLIAWLFVFGIIGGFGALIYFAIDMIDQQNRPLTAGECLDFTGVGDSADMERRSCGEPHDAEVLLKIDVPGDDTSPLPAQALFESYVSSQCVPEFNRYTGRDYATDTELSIGYVHPSSTGWFNGLHTLTCYIDRVDSSKLTSSVHVPSQ